MEFDLPKEQNSIIKVIGVGGGGGNAVNHMYNLGIKGVDFVVCNTDHQALDISPVPIKVQIGSSLTEGRGAGAKPEIGKNAAIENIEEIREILEANTKMVFITAGMGGGTGTGAAPIIAKVAKEMGILTVGIVTVPFSFEGKKRKIHAEEGLEEMRKNVDTLLIINNDRLREMFGNLTLGNAFSQADDVLSTAAKGIAELIADTGYVNVDFNDVSTVMKDSGVAIMGSATAEGENRAIEAARRALSSPLLNDNDIEGATYVLLNITYGDSEILMDEIGEITDYIQEEAGMSADVIWGHGQDSSLGNAIGLTVIATGFQTSPISGFEKAPEKKVIDLEQEDVPTMITQPIESPIESKWTETPKQENTWTTESSVSEETEEEALPYLKTTNESEQTEINWSFTSESAKSEETESWSNLQPKQEESTPQANTENDDDVIRHYLTDEEDESVEMTSQPAKTVLSQEEQAMRAKERMDRIQSYTEKLKSQSGISQMEEEPAYKRKSIEFEDVPHSSEENMSKFTLGGDGNRGGLSENNSFLHDNVD